MLLAIAIFCYIQGEKEGAQYAALWVACWHADGFRYDARDDDSMFLVSKIIIDLVYKVGMVLVFLSFLINIIVWADGVEGTCVVYEEA